MSQTHVSTGQSQLGTQAAHGVSPGMWAITLIVASLLSWFAYTHPPKTWRVPDSMANIGPLSPAPEQAKLAANQNSNLWNNTLLKFSLAGLGMGVCGFVLFSNRLGTHLPAALWTLISGMLAGLAAGALGLVVRKYFDLEHPIPMISESSRPLVCDSLVFALVSTILLVPVAVMLSFHPHSDVRGKALSVLLAGVLTGMLVPFASALLFAHTNTGVFPPVSADPSLAISRSNDASLAIDAPVTAEDLAKANMPKAPSETATTGGFNFGLIELWFLTLCVTSLLLVLFSGSRTPKPAANNV